MPKTRRRTKAEDLEDRFVAEYLAANQNATLAYMRTHPRSSIGSARSNAARMMIRDGVRAKIRAARRRLLTDGPAKAERIVAELAKIAFADVGDIFDFTGGGVPNLKPGNRIPASARQAIVGLETTEVTVGKKTVVKAKVRLADKQKALERLATILGLFQEPPPLEVFFAALPTECAAELRRAMAVKLWGEEAVAAQEAADRVPAQLPATPTHAASPRLGSAQPFGDGQTAPGGGVPPPEHPDGEGFDALFGDP